MDVSTVVVSYNTRELTKACLESVFEKTEGVDFEVIVVDNASADGSAAMIGESCPKVELVESDRNLGFAAANNLAFKRARGKYVFLLNPDAILLNNAIGLFFDFMEDDQNSRVGAVGAYLLDDQLQVSFSGGSFFGLRKLRYDLVPPRMRQGLKSILGPRLSARLARSLTPPRIGEFGAQEREATSRNPWTCNPVDWISGADLFMRKRVLDEIGVFDERYFLYAEEMDLQYRMSKARHKRLLIAGPRIVHLVSQSIDPMRAQILLKSSNIEFLRKNSPLKYAAFRLARSLTIQSGKR